MHRYSLQFLMGFCAAAACAGTPCAHGQNSKWVTTGTTGRLIYVPDADGDRVADFSMAGYAAGKKPLPTALPVVIRIDPIAGDNTEHIQNAINYAASLPLQSSGFRGVVELGPGKFNVNGRLNITTSGVVLRGSGDGDSVATNTHIVSQNRTDSISSASTPVINISGSSSGTTRGAQVQIIDKRVPVGAQSFRVASTAGMSVGGMVEIYRPSTQAWIEELGMHLIPDGKHWTAGSRDLRWHRTITRIEGDRVFFDAPITTALDAQWGGGTIRTYNAPNVIRNVGVENLRGQSLDAREESNEDRTPTFVRFTRVADGWVRDVQTRHFSYASVFTSEADGGRHITVQNVHSRLPSGQVTGGRRYTFAMDGQYSLVTNSSADSGRHDFVTGSDVVGPIVFHNSSTTTTRSDSGPHHRWGNGLLFDNVTVGGNAINVQNRWTSGSGHGWAGANVVVWNSQANSFIMQAPPTAKGWLVGSSGTINAGNCHLGGATCAGYYDSHGTRVTAGGTQSLYEAQVSNAADIRDFRWAGGDGLWSDAARWDQRLTPAVYRISTRDYLVGDIDKFVHDGAGSVDNAYVDPAWAGYINSQVGQPITGFDDLTGGRNVAFTVQSQLDLGERIIHASLALSLKATGSGSVANDFIHLFDGDPANRLTFSQLGWASQVNASAPFVGVIDLSNRLDQLQTGSLNVLVSNDTGVDWAMYTASVATPLSGPAASRVVLGGGGRVTLDHVPLAVGSLQLRGTLALTPAGRLVIANELSQPSGGKLQIELDSNSAGLMPRLHIGGRADLAGSLEVSFAEGFSPSANTSFHLLAAGGGLFATAPQVLLPELAAGLKWDLQYTPHSLYLQVVASMLNGIAGDVNQDGIIDHRDVDAFLAGWMTTGWTDEWQKYTNGDLNFDGVTDLADAFILHRALQTEAGSGFPFALLDQPFEPTFGVPEPAAHILIVLGPLGWSLRRRRPPCPTDTTPFHELPL